MNDNIKAQKLVQTIMETIVEKKPESIAQTAILVRDRLRVSEEEVIDAILYLQKKGRIKLKDQSIYSQPNIAAYLKTRRAFWYWATIVIAITTVIIVFTIPEDSYPWSYLRNAMGLVFTLWLPGFTFIKTIFPIQTPVKTSAESLDKIERFAINLVMSLALVPLIGLMLYYTPWGLNLSRMVLSLFAMTLILATIALVREFKLRVNQT